MWKKNTVNATLERVKIIVIGEAYSSESVSQIRGSWEEALRMELTSRQENTKEMSVVRYKECDMDEHAPSMPRTL